MLSGKHKLLSHKEVDSKGQAWDGAHSQACRPQTAGSRLGRTGTEVSVFHFTFLGPFSGISQKCLTSSHITQGTGHFDKGPHCPWHGFQNAQLRLSQHSRNSGLEGGSSGPRRERLPSVCEALGLMSMHISGQGDTGLPQQVGVGQRVRSSRSFLVSSKPAWVIGDPVGGKTNDPHTPTPAVTPESGVWRFEKVSPMDPCILTLDPKFVAVWGGRASVCSRTPLPVLSTFSRLPVPAA